MDSFSLVLFLTPLLVYMLGFSLMRLSGRCHVTTGGREIVALAFAVSGMMVVGPVELFFPMAAAAVFGVMVWAILSLFYCLCVCLLVLGAAPKLVVYGCRPSELSDFLLSAARSLDTDAEIDHERLQVHLPSVGVRLRIAGPENLDHATIVAFEDNLSTHFWLKLRDSLRAQLMGKKTSQRRGWLMFFAAIMLGGFLVAESVQSVDVMAADFQAWLWR